MRSKLAAVIFLLAVSTICVAQFTDVTGTVIDPNGLPYVYGTVAPVLITNGVTPTLNGQVYSPPNQPAGLDVNGNFILHLASTSVLQPSGLKWNFQVCSALGTVPPAFGFASRCFQLPVGISITGATQDITTQLHAVALALTRLFGSAGAGCAVPAGTNNDILYSLGLLGCGTAALQWFPLTNSLQFPGPGTFEIETGYSSGLPAVCDASNSCLSWDTNGVLNCSINGGAWFQCGLNVGGTITWNQIIDRDTTGVTDFSSFFDLLSNVNCAAPFVCLGGGGANSGIVNSSSMTDDLANPPTSSHGFNVRTLGAYDVEIPANGTTGVGQFLTACDDGTGKVLTCNHTTSTTNVPAGIVQSCTDGNSPPTYGSCGTTGDAVVSGYGFLTIKFDNTATAFHYAQQSSTVDGELSDVGATAPTNAQPYYFIWIGNSGAGTAGVVRILTGDELNASQTGGGGTQVQVNGAQARKEANFNDTTPAAAANGINLKWQISSSGNLSNISGYILGDGNPAHGLCGNGVFAATCVGAAAVTFQTNTVNNISQTTLNLLNSAANCGFTVTLTNGSAGNVTLGLSGSTITGSCLPTANTTFTKTWNLLDFVDATDSGKLQFENGQAVHLTRVYCSVVGATNAVINLDKRSEGSPNTDTGNHLLGGDLTCGTTGANTSTFSNGAGQCGGTGSCAVALHTNVVLTLTSVSGAATGDALRVTVEGTID